MPSESTALGYLAQPAAGSVVHGAVVLVHDVWGLYDHFRELADRLAAAGFVTLAIELYRRTPELKISDAGAFMRELSDPDVLADIQAGVDSLRPHGRVAVIGFCMGGMYALLSGAALRDVSAVVPFYGILSHAHGLLFSETGLDAKKKPKEPVRAARELRCPMLAYYGDQDVYVPITDIDALREQASASGQRCEIHVVPGAGHAFMNETRTQAYVPDAARAAWQRMLEFLRSELRG